MKAKAVDSADAKTPLESAREQALSSLNDDSTEEPRTAPFLEPVTITTTRTFLKSGRVSAAEEKSETLLVRDFLVPPARVGVDIGQTINLGNYESLRIGVTAQVPCYVEEMADAYDHVVAFARERVVAEREQAAVWAKKKSVENLF